MRRLSLAMPLALFALGCSGSNDSSGGPPLTMSSALAAPTTTATTTSVVVTATTATEAELSLAQREAELIQLIAADAIGPEEWIEPAARALAAEQLILERPGEVDLLDYFTDDSPYLEATVRPAHEDFRDQRLSLDGVLATLVGVEVAAEGRDQVTLGVETINGRFTVTSPRTASTSISQGGQRTWFLLLLDRASGRWRTVERSRPWELN